MPTGPREPVSARPARRAWIWPVYAALYALSIPWYLTPGETPMVWMGLPHWVVLSLASTTAIAGFTAWVVWRHWPAPDEGWEPGPHLTDSEAAPASPGVRGR